MGVPAEKRLEVMKRRDRVAELVAQLTPPWRIAERLSLPLHTVQSDLAALAQLRLRQMKDGMEIDKARQLARIDELEIQYRKAYEKSCLPKKRKRTLKKTRMQKVSDDGQRIEVSDGGEKIVETETRSAGDPRFLQGIEWCIAERNKLLGHYPKADAVPASMPVMVIVGPQSNVQVNAGTPPPLPITPPPLPRRLLPPAMDLESLLPPAFTFDESATMTANQETPAIEKPDDRTDDFPV